MFNSEIGLQDITIHSIKLELEDWVLYQEDEKIRIWTNKFGDVLTVNFFRENPNLPHYVSNIHSLRNFYREAIIESNGAIVEVEKENFGSFLVIRTIFKIAQNPTGFTYLASFSFIMENYTFIIKVECPERGMTGARECAVLLIAEMEGVIPKGTMEGWFYDPYDPAFKNQISSNVSDQEKYDKHFPDHPLSRARNTLAQIREHLVLDKNITPVDLYFKEL